MTGAQGQPGMTGLQGRPGVAGAANPAPAGTSWTSLRDTMFDDNQAEIRPTEMSKIADIATYTIRIRPFVSVSMGRRIFCAGRTSTTLA
jgi:hypothetical protein